jgi:hypothetical protein
MGDRSNTLPFWIPVFVFFPGGPQRRERLSPGVAVGVNGSRAGGTLVRGLPVGGIYLFDSGPVGLIGGIAVSWVQ